MSAPPENARLRQDIQGLRGVAVGLVLLFHVWPRLLPGGYVGVDVFFVISGYLITSLLLREAAATGGIDFATFYLRRARRLLPAATLVLAVVVLTTPLLLPAHRWAETAAEVVASATYVENWWLAHAAVDYLSAENAASPVQHYWSLSIEEQFYIVWPALIALASLVAARLRLGANRVVRAVVVAVVGVSLLLSIQTTRAEPAQAYFFSHARVWELAIGAALAAWPRALPRPIAGWLGLAGIVAILYAAITFSAATPFPGYMALLPVLGAAAVLAAGADGGGYRVLAIRPLTFVGDISYSLYLWHWPLIVFHAAYSGREPGLWSGLALVVVAVGLAWVSKRQVEDRFRHVREGGRGVVKLVAAAAIPVGLALALLGYIHAAGRVDATTHPGARVLDGVQAPEGKGYAPALEALGLDRAAAYDNGCHLSFAGDEPVACRFGDPSGALKVWVVGDSHAVNWLPAIEEIAKRRQWNVSSYTKSSCGWMPVMTRRDGQPYRECRAWGQRLFALLEQERPDVVIVSQMYSHRTHARNGGKAPSVPAALRRTWSRIEASGAQVVVIADTPRWARDPGQCLARDAGCALPLRQLAHRDPQLSALRKAPTVGLVDMTDTVCPDARCPVVIGNVVVWRDRHHLTASYARSAADILERRLTAASTRLSQNE
ncbi:acyltransferase family protein [Stenotrophomonas mori]|uniref:Acyltransferase n=1 Tax=Stenotrophomonas mori TaxID=2871096 RepID=A0ABT0SHX1_9GAMM|nr:acyltransferase family protein [Stenotrophomonas mori]MCL7714942.1 acyltransferase [Stenotrophomonas mori]